MLSSESPSGPSCSSNSAGPGVRADLVTSAAEAPPCQDLVQQSPKFSMRDYVFASRSQGIKRSWPFHPNLLQLCLKRGVKDPLPPFEPPDKIRTPPLNTLTDDEQSAAHSEDIACVGLVKTRDAGSSNMDMSDINFQSSQPVDESSLGPSPCTSPENGKSSIDQVESTNELDHTDGLIPVDLQDNSWSKVSRRTEVAGLSWRLKNLDSSCKTSRKRCKHIVKFGTVTDIRRTEDLAYNSSSVSDPMASKTCPVCKVFVSTSNTTLNAHIDQCLSVESNTELEMVPVKPKFKAKKTSTLSAHMDRYVSVQSNTELVETVLVKPKVKIKQKRLMVDIYKTALPYTLEDLDLRNGTNWATELAMTTVNNEVCTENQSPEVVSFDARDDKWEGDVYVDSNGIKIRILSKCTETPLGLSDELGTKKVPKQETGKGILVRKKILKSKFVKKKKLKMHGKKFNRMNHLNFQVQAYPHGGIDEDEDTTVAEMQAQNPTASTSHHGSRTVKQWVCSKRSDIRKNDSRKLHDKTFDKVASGAQKLARGRMLGFDRSQAPESPSGAFSSQPSEEMGTSSEENGVEQRNDSSILLRLSSKTSLQESVLPKVPRSAAAVAKRKIREIGMREANKSDNYDIIKNSNSVKRSGVRSSFSIAGPSNGPNRLASSSKRFQKQRSLLRTGRRAFSPSDSRLLHCFGQNNEPVTRHASKKFRLTTNTTLKKFVKDTEEEQDTADNDFSFGSDMPLSGQQDNQYDAAQQTEGTETDYGGEEPETDTAYASVSTNDPADSFNEISYGSLSPENNETDRDIFVEGYGVGVEDPSSREQLLCRANESKCVINNEMDEWQVDPALSKESTACVTNNKDMGSGAPQDNSSITSNGDDSCQEHCLPFGQDSMESPVSTASTMSPTAKDRRTKESEPGPSSVRTIEEHVTGSLNPEIKSIPMARDGENLPNEKPFCCSCRGSISLETQLNHQSDIARPMLNFSVKRVPQLNIGLTASSSFSMYQRTSSKVNPFFNPHDQPLAAKVSDESSYMNLPSYTTECTSPSLQTQLPSPSNPILRLMGKNLMVMNNEDSVHPPAPSSEYILRGNYVAPVGFVAPNYQHPNDSAFMNTAPATAKHQIPLSSVQDGKFSGLPLHGSTMMPPGHYSQQKSYGNIVPVMHHPTYTMKEVIVIDDAPERRSEPQVSMLPPPATASSQATFLVPNTMAHGPFYCLPSSPPVLPRERAADSLPIFANVGSMVGASSSSQRSQTEASNPYMLSPFFVHPQTGYVNPSMYYPQNLRR